MRSAVGFIGLQTRAEVPLLVRDLKYRFSTNSNERRIAMDFMSFLVLLIISIVVCGILHYGFKYYIVPGLWSYLSKVVIGWVGARLGTPVFGEWWEGVNYGDVYYVPAILGCLLLVIFAVDVVKTTKDGKAAKAPAKRKRKR
jgi:uncharacterized membrane protein YeaQ/YmgE (transglycosylase-associated protein family)